MVRYMIFRGFRMLFYNSYVVEYRRKHAFDRFSQSFLEANTLWILKESKYVRLADTIYRVLRNSWIPMFLHRKSNLFSVWQHNIVFLLTIRQYESKSFRKFVEWLVEAYYLRTFLQLSHIPHFTTLQKFAPE